MKNSNVNFKQTLRQDDVFVPSEVKSLTEMTGLSTISSKSHAIICGDQIVNVVSEKYCHMPNEQFFLSVEEKLINADIKYIQRSINNDNRTFAIDYILDDESYFVNVKTKNDKIRPMLRFVNAYDGSCKTTGSFGFFREVCSNGLHIAESNIGFSIKHKKGMNEIVMPSIDQIINKFMKNEFYELQKKFEVLAERPIYDLSEFVELTCKNTELFTFETSEKNPEPSKKALRVMDIISNESNALGIEPNMWIGYNAFNQIVHELNIRNFDTKRKIDTKIFDFIVENN